jgi:hypothetical protein
MHLHDPCPPEPGSPSFSTALACLFPSPPPLFLNTSAPPTPPHFWSLLSCTLPSSFPPSLVFASLLLAHLVCLPALFSFPLLSWNRCPTSSLSPRGGTTWCRPPLTIRCGCGARWTGSRSRPWQAMRTRSCAQTSPAVGLFSSLLSRPFPLFPFLLFQLWSPCSPSFPPPASSSSDGPSPCFRAKLLGLVLLRPDLQTLGAELLSGGGRGKKRGGIMASLPVLIERKRRF